MIVFGGGPITLGQLAAAEQVRPPTITKLVVALEAGGPRRARDRSRRPSRRAREGDGARHAIAQRRPPTARRVARRVARRAPGGRSRHAGAGDVRSRERRPAHLILTRREVVRCCHDDTILSILRALTTLDRQRLADSGGAHAAAIRRHHARRWRALASAILLVPGSLFSDVNGDYPAWNSFPHVYAHLAHQLSARGHAVYRFAKLGPGTGSVAVDAEQSAAVQHLGRPRW